MRFPSFLFVKQKTIPRYEFIITYKKESVFIIDCQKSMLYLLFVAKNYIIIK